jgi:hypothetical protein
MDFLAKIEETAIHRFIVLTGIEASDVVVAPRVPWVDVGRTLPVRFSPAPDLHGRP